MRGLPKDDNKHGWTMYVWLIYLSFFLVVPALRPHASAWEWTATIAAALVFLPLYLRGYSVRGRDIILVMAGITLIGLIFYPFNPGAGSFFIYATAFACRLTTTRATLRAILIVEFVLCIEIWVFHVPIYNAVWPFLFAAMIGAVNSHYEEVNRSNRRLHLAQDEIERLAKLAERERIGRDLHDLLGHTLSLIVLKSELASKLADKDPARAAIEIRDVERISRETLAQVRATVRGYQSRSLQAEAEQAKAALQAAGVEVLCDFPPATIPASHEGVLALALREAVTNVIRHAGAKSCNLRLEQTSNTCLLEIKDDGCGELQPEGVGLSGMRQRVEALGGSLRRETSSGTRLIITLPVVSQ